LESGLDFWQEGVVLQQHWHWVSRSKHYGCHNYHDYHHDNKHDHNDDF